MSDAPCDPADEVGDVIAVLVVGSDAAADRLRQAGRDGALSVSHLPEDAEVGDVTDTEYDCLVLADTVDVDWATVRNVAAPVVLYGGVDDLPDAPIHRDIDLVLERRPEADGGLLVEKIRTVAETSTAPSTRAEAVEAVTTDTGSVAAFLVDDAGDVRWSAAGLAEVLPPGAKDRLPPETASLYERLGTVFQPHESTGLSEPAFADLPGSTEERDGALLWLAAGEEGGYYRHYSYPVGVGSADRIELLQNVTTTVGSHDRLALFEELVENAQDGLFVLNADWQVEYLNRTYAQLLGFDREELLGTHVAQQLSPGEMQRAQAATERLIDGEAESAVIDITLQRGDGTDVEASVHFWARYTDDGRYAGLMGAVRDITDRKARERELERYETIVQAVGDPVCTIDAEGRFVYVNDAFEERTGYELSTLRGEPISLVIGADAAATGEALITELLADPDSTTATFELQLPDRDGATTPTECQIALLPQEDGQYQGAVVVMRDISRLKRREQRLSKFAGVVSHDLRNPLDVALGRAEVLPDVADLDPEAEHHVGEIYESLKRMEQLIEDVLAIARHGEMAVDLAPVSLEEVAAEAWASVETGDAELRIASTATVRAHRSRLLRLFENLFRNAIEHGGPDVLVEVGTIDDGSDAGFYVADDGSGIPGDQRDVIFDDGFSTTADGTGLGLSIVSEIVRAHDWSIDIADGIDGGARFEFTGVAAADGDAE